jgi:hypothetical protein
VAGKGILDAVIAALNEQGIDVSSLPQGPAATAQAIAHAKKQQIETEAQRKREEEQRALDSARSERERQEQEASLRPLSFRAPVPYKEQNFGVSGELILGNVSEADLTAPLVRDTSSSLLKAASLPTATGSSSSDGAVSQSSLTPEEWSQKGKEAFASGAFHEQIVTILDKTPALLRPVYNLLVSDDENKNRVVPRLSTFACNDIQYQFENDMENIDKLDQVPLILFPLYLIGDGSRAAQLSIYTASNVLPLARPSNFVLNATFKKKESGYWFKSLLMLLIEDPKTSRILDGVLTPLMDSIADAISVIRQKRIAQQQPAPTVINFPSPTTPVVPSVPPAPSSAAAGSSNPGPMQAFAQAQQLAHARTAAMNRQRQYQQQALRGF